MFLLKLKQFFIKNKLRKVFNKYPVIFAYIFGSFAKGQINLLSDIDIAVYFDEKINVEERLKFRYDIQDEIKIKLKNKKEIDIVSLNDAKPLLEREVVYNGKIIYSKSEAKRTHYEANAIGRWLDWKWYEDQFNKAIEEQFLKPVKPYVQ